MTISASSNDGGLEQDDAGATDDSYEGFPNFDAEILELEKSIREALCLIVIVKSVVQMTPLSHCKRKAVTANWYPVNILQKYHINRVPSFKVRHFDVDADLSLILMTMSMDGNGSVYLDYEHNDLIITALT